MEDLITKIEQMQAEARDGMKRASRDSDPYLYQYLVGKFHAFGKVAGILKKQKECVADSSKTSADEDERTRKEIIHYLFYTAGGLSIEEQNRWIAYLEKQKEQKPAEWSEDIIRKAVKEVGLTQHQIDWFKTNVFPPKQEWSEEDERILKGIIGKIDHNQTYGVSKVGMLSFLQSLRPQPKQEWSEEDEKMLVGIIERGSAQIPPYEPALRGEQMEWLMNRLKSLRPVSKESLQSWKPTEEQMKALQNAIALTACDKELVRLYNQLKKL